MSLMTITKVTERLTHPRAADATHKSHLVDPVMSLFPHELTEQKVFPTRKTFFPSRLRLIPFVSLTISFSIHPKLGRLAKSKKKSRRSRYLFIKLSNTSRDIGSSLTESGVAVELKTTRSLSAIFSRKTNIS